MVEFKELRITPDGKTLIIDVAVKDLPYYEDIQLEGIYIDTQDTYVDAGPSSNCAYSKEVTGKSCRLELNAGDLQPSLTENLFFVYVKVTGTPSADTPCGMDNETTLGVIANMYPFYRASINYIKEINNDCEIPVHFIDNLLRYKALDLSIKTGHYTQAIMYWNKFFKTVKTQTVNNICSCHG